MLRDLRVGSEANIHGKCFLRRRKLLTLFWMITEHWSASDHLADVGNELRVTELFSSSSNRTFSFSRSIWTKTTRSYRSRNRSSAEESTSWWTYSLNRPRNAICCRSRRITSSTVPGRTWTITWTFRIDDETSRWRSSDHTMSRAFALLGLVSCRR